MPLMIIIDVADFSTIPYISPAVVYKNYPFAMYKEPCIIFLHFISINSHRIIAMPVEPKLAKCLLTSLTLGCSDEILSIAAMCSVEYPFISVTLILMYVNMLITEQIFIQ
jgi:hypothetical protein